MDIPFRCALSPTGVHPLRLVLAQDYTVMHISSPCSKAPPEAIEAMRRLESTHCCIDAEAKLRAHLKRSSAATSCDDLRIHCASALAAATLRLAFDKITEKSREARVHERPARLTGMGGMGDDARRHHYASLLSRQVQKACAIPYDLLDSWKANVHVSSFTPPFKVEVISGPTGELWTSYSLKVATPAVRTSHSKQIAVIHYDCAAHAFKVTPSANAHEVATLALCASDGHCLCCHGRKYSAGKRHRQGKKHVENVLRYVRKIQAHFKILGGLRHG